MQNPDSHLPFRAVPKTGVIYVMTEAVKAGYTPGSADWANLGQGAPEIGLLDGSPPRVGEVRIQGDDHEYAPVDGLLELRQAVADLYNARYRQGKASQYTAANVAISPGGRSALTRLVRDPRSERTWGTSFPTTRRTKNCWERLAPSSRSPSPSSADHHYDVHRLSQLRDEILDRGLSAVLLSNPCNPTGHARPRRAAEGNWVKTAQGSCRLHPHPRRVLQPLRLRGRPISRCLAAAQRRRRGRGPGRHRRRPHQELALPGLARLLDRGAARHHRHGIASAGSFLDGGLRASRCRRRPAPAATARSPTPRPTAIQTRCSAPSAQLLLDGLEAPGDHGRTAAAPGRLLLLGRSVSAPRRQEHRNGSFPSWALEAKA